MESPRKTGVMGDPTSIAAIATAFAAGILSVLSPCVMPLMPAYLSLISGVSVDEMRSADAGTAPGLRRRVLLGCAGFVSGFSAVFVLLGASATLLGRPLQAWRVDLLGLEITAVQLAGLVIIGMGLHLMGLVRIPVLYRDVRPGQRLEPKSLLGTCLVGAAFAFGWSPCVGPILGGILTVAGGRETVYQGMLLLAVYSAGLAVPFFLAGWSIEYFFRTFGRVKRHLRKVEAASGALLLAVGMLVLTNRLADLNAYFLFLDDVVEAAQRALL
jgi:cytochrome c-type biogenesis protein